MRRLLFLIGLFAVVALAIWLWPRPKHPNIPIFPLPKIVQPKLERPYGMAPAAFAGFVRACEGTPVHPFRIGQTIGNHPRSVGYHKRDGVLKIGGQNLDYCAAVDIGTFDLNRAQIHALLENLARQGFAAFYREGPKWKGGEHIHAIYAGLPMKPQLRRQVREWVRKRRKNGQRIYEWQSKNRRFWSYSQ